MCVLCNSADKLHNHLNNGTLSDGVNNTSGGFNNSSFVNSSTPLHIGSLLLGYSLSGAVNTASSVTYSAISSANQTFINAMNYSVSKAAQVANISFQALPIPNNTATILFAEDNLLSSGNLGITDPFILGTSLVTADITIDNSLNYAFGSGDGILTMLHELGHALGLKHPGNPVESPEYIGGGGIIGPFLPVSEDSYNTTVMSYLQGNPANDANQPQSFMIYDIAALQHLYGANRGFNAGNDTYTYDGSKSIETIWDGGGVDTLRALISSTIELREGSAFFSSIGQARIWNAFGANIENAIGSTGADIIHGNDLNNNLVGNAGNDIIFGYRGSDIIDLGEGNDTIFAGKGFDTIIGALGSDILNGEKGNDYIKGGRGDDIINGGDENDTLSGDRGNDKLSGAEGFDIFQFRSGDGNDVINDFERGVDKIQIDPSIYSSAEQAVSSLIYSGGNATLNIIDGSITILGVNQGAISANDFIIALS